MTMNYTSYCGSFGCFHPIRPGEVLSVKKNDMWDEFDGVHDEECSGDCSDCPVMDCEHNERREK